MADYGEALGMVEPDALQLRFPDSLRCDGVSEVGSPGHGGPRLLHDLQPEHRPPDEIERIDQDERDAAYEAEQEVIDQPHIVIERRPVGVDLFLA